MQVEICQSIPIGIYGLEILYQLSIFYNNNYTISVDKYLIPLYIKAAQRISKIWIPGQPRPQKFGA